MLKQRRQRKSPRKAIHKAYVEYSKSGTRLSRLFHPEIRRGPLVNVGRDGVEFRTTEYLDQGEVVFMTLRFAVVPEPIKLKAEVRWCREEKKTGVEDYTHMVGAQFVEFTPHAWDLITAALKA